MVTASMILLIIVTITLTLIKKIMIMMGTVIYVMIINSVKGSIISSGKILKVRLLVWRITEEGGTLYLVISLLGKCIM